jgi:hypothetical protein
MSAVSTAILQYFPLAAPPAKKGPLQELGIEPVGLGAPVSA